MSETSQQLLNATHSWNVISNSLQSVSCKYENWKVPSSQEFHDAVINIHQLGASHLIRDYFLRMFEEDLRSVIIPKFWECYNAKYNDSFCKFPVALGNTYDRMQKYYPAITELQMAFNQLEHLEKPVSLGRKLRLSKGPPKSILNEMLELLRALLLSQWPVDFRSVLVEYYSRTFCAFQAKQKGPGGVVQVEGHQVCTGCDKEVQLCSCKQYLDLFYIVNKQLFELQLLEYVVGDIPINLTQEYLEKHILQTCTGSFEVSYLESLKNWLNEIPLKWLSDVYVLEQNSSCIKNLLLGYKERLFHTLYDAYAKVRLDQLFNVIIEFPDSQAALEDLRECINSVGLRPKVVCSLRTSMKKRLLHPGVNTSDILTAYVSSIKALKVLDSSGVVLQSVCEPVCKYLRTREDTVRCIVSGLTDDSSEELATELMKGLPLVLEDSYQSDDENENWETWSPDPVDADPTKVAKGQRSSDIISMLVNIYGSKELFVNEYRTLLADRLLGKFSYNTEREIRYLELLKLRFGESHMHYCEVMLKDVADSKRINAHLNSGDLPNYKGGDFPVNAMILSGQFWPPFKEEKLKLPDYIWQHLVKYTEAFEALKGNRSLVWKPHLGVVHLEIELKERTLELDVGPVHATILWHFQDKPQWTIDELSAEMQIQASVLRRKITFWQSHGILREEEQDVFLLVEEQESSNQESIMVIEEERESVTASSHDQREEELQIFWSYIVGMLTNMESLPLERIHSMLRMFAMQGPNTNEFTIQGIKQFLDKKVRERKLLYSGGLYRLPRFES